MSKLNPLIYIFILTSLYKQVSVYCLCPPTTFYFYFCIILTQLFQPLMKTSFVQTRRSIEQINYQSSTVRSALLSILSADSDLHKDPAAFSCCCWSKWSLQELFANNKHVDLNNLLALSLENRCLELFFGFLTEKSSSGLRQSFNVERVKRLCSYQDIWA